MQVASSCTLPACIATPCACCNACGTSSPDRLSPLHQPGQRLRPAMPGSGCSNRAATLPPSAAIPAGAALPGRHRTQLQLQQRLMRPPGLLPLPLLQQRCSQLAAAVPVLPLARRSGGTAAAAAGARPAVPTAAAAAARGSAAQTPTPPMQPAVAHRGQALRLLLLPLLQARCHALPLTPGALLRLALPAMPQAPPPDRPPPPAVIAGHQRGQQRRPASRRRGAREQAFHARCCSMLAQRPPCWLRPPAAACQLPHPA